MTQLPAGLEAYKRTPIFTEQSVPAGLLKDHSTKDGTWGMIHVEEGCLTYVITDPRRPQSERTLTRDSDPGVVEPTILHRVHPSGKVRFWVEFWRDGAGSTS
jgi:tellurite resistance-related uncharacterized protein